MIASAVDADTTAGVEFLPEREYRSMGAPYVSIVDPRDPQAIARVINGVISVRSLDVGQLSVKESQSWVTAVPVTSVGAGGSLDVLLRTSPNESFNGGLTLTARGETQLTFYEEPTVTDEGTPLPVLSKNRVEPQDPESTLFVGPTVTDTGLKLMDKYLPDANAQPDGVKADLRGWILKLDALYLVRATNLGNGASDMGYVFAFVEGNS